MLDEMYECGLIGRGHIVDAQAETRVLGGRGVCEDKDIIFVARHVHMPRSIDRTLQHLAFLVVSKD